MVCEASLRTYTGQNGQTGFAHRELHTYSKTQSPLSSRLIRGASSPMENPIGFSFVPQTSYKPHMPHLSAQSSSSPNSRGKNSQLSRICAHFAGKRKRTPEDIDMESSNSNFDSTSGHSIDSLSTKRIRNLPIGRPLPMSRLLDSLSKDALQEVLKNLCQRHPGLSSEVYKYCAKPTVHQAMGLLSALERKLQDSFPFGGDAKGEYAYNRVLPSIKELLGALLDYTPHFLPPNEAHLSDTMEFLDGATAVISRLPDWNNINHSLLKREAYEEINGAWSTAFKEAVRRGNFGASVYRQKLKHWNDVSNNQLSGALLLSERSIDGGHIDDADGQRVVIENFQA